MRFYLDAAPVIYLVEQVSPYYLPLSRRLAQSGGVLVVSELTRLECRVKPLKFNDIDLLRDYDEFFNYSVVEVVPLSRAVMELATEIRARYGFRTPDSIHLAAARHALCEVFLTNDHQLVRYADIRVEIV